MQNAIDKLKNILYIKVAKRNGGDKMVNTRKLKSKMIEKGYTYQTLATKINLTAYTLGQKVANKKKMTLEEANILSKELGIDDEEFKDIFLKKELQNATKNGD